MIIEPYLNFDGRCDEAIEFYKTAIGAKVEMLMRFKDSPAPHNHGDVADDKVMHSSLKVGNGRIMLTDGFAKGKPNFHGINLSLSVDSADEARRCFNALADGGKITMPMDKTFFSPAFGMAEDKFGVSWMVMAQPS